MGFPAAGEPSDEGMLVVWIAQEATEGERVDLPGRVVETMSGAGAKESGDGSDGSGGIGEG